MISCRSDHVYEGHSVISLNLDISDLRFLTEFPQLTTLVVDDNQITSQVKVPFLPKLHTLWLNHNRIKNLGTRYFTSFSL